MICGKIYKVTNNINGKVYIGQTVRDLDVRMERHFKDAKYNADNFCFHRAINKYGATNFTTTILEDNIPKNQLNDREIYWIDFYHSYIKDPLCNGYNMTRGGDSMLDVIRKLSDNDILEIKQLLRETALTEEEIAIKYDISLFAVSDINIGKSWRDADAEYPIRKREIQEITFDMFIEIIEMIKSQLFSYSYICQKFNLTNSSISHINTGRYTKYNYPQNINFPISSIKTISYGKLNVLDTLNLLLDALDGMTRKDLSQKYQISEAYCKSVLCLNNKSFLQDLKRPFRMHPEYNKQLLLHKINTYHNLK